MTMKRLKLKILIPLIIGLLVACDDPLTEVTDIVRSDGSVLRKIEMRSSKNNIEGYTCQVPYDHTWKISDSIEIGSKKDTTWIRRAEKIFKNTTELDNSYKNDTSKNGKSSRHTNFSRKFRWFNTEYRFSEVVDKKLETGISLKSFLNEEEYRYYSYPNNIKGSMENGADSLKYRSLSDTIKKKTNNWLIKNIVDSWLREFTKLTEGRPRQGFTLDSLIKNEGHIIKILNLEEPKFDSIWKTGVIQKKIFGEKIGSEFRIEIDSALNNAVSNILVDFNDYTLKFVMPGKLTATNGYIDSTRNLMWLVSSDFFTTDQYEMWAESKTRNLWAWILSGLFLAFVITGFVVRKKRVP
jgi:hypothetical protein